METTPMRGKAPAEDMISKEPGGLEAWWGRNAYLLVPVSALLALLTFLIMLPTLVYVANTTTELATLKARIAHLEEASKPSSRPPTAEAQVQTRQEYSNLSRALDAVRRELDQRASQSSVEVLEEGLKNQSEVVLQQLDDFSRAVGALRRQLEQKAPQSWVEESLKNQSEVIETVESQVERGLEQSSAAREQVGELASRMSSAEEGLLNASAVLVNVSRRAERMEKVTLFSSCKDYLDRGFTTSGVYKVYLPPHNSAFNVFCDMDTDGGGWMVFQRRKDGSEDFYRTWAEYERGFGNLHGEFWLGNKKLHELTSSGRTHLRVDMEEWGGRRTNAKYSRFSVGPSQRQYRLLVSGYSGTAGDGLGYHSGAGFTTRDLDHDSRIENCAEKYHGAFWYKSCHLVNPNGRYSNSDTPDWAHVVWGLHFNSVPPPLKFIEMKLR